MPMNPLTETYRGVVITHGSDIISGEHIAHFTFPAEPHPRGFQSQMHQEMRPGSPGERRTITSWSGTEVLAEAKRQIDAFLDGSPFIQS